MAPSIYKPLKHYNWFAHCNYVYGTEISKLRENATSLNHFYATYDLKTILTKTILSPYITYLAHIHPPKKYKN